MRKTIMVVSLIVLTSSAEAAQRNNFRPVPQRPVPHYVAPRVPHYVAPRVPQYVVPHRRYVPRSNNWVPGVILGLGAGAIVGSYYYNNRNCWNEPVLDVYGRQAYDAYGQPMIDRVCN